MLAMITCSLALSSRRTIMEDPFIREHIEELLRNIRTQVLIKLIRPYTRVRILFIAQVCICMYTINTHVHVYTRTSLNGPTKMRTTSVEWTARKALFDYSMCLVHFNLRETDNCNLSVPDNGHSAWPRMIVAVQKSL